MNFLDLLNNGLEFFKDTSIGKLTTSFIYLFVLIVISIKPVKTFFDDMRKSKVKKLEMVLSEGKDYLEENTKQFLKVNLEEAYFKLATGLYLGKGFQNAMMELYVQNGCNVSFYNFKQAVKYMKYDDKEGKIINVKINFFETCIGLVFAFLGFLLFFMNIVLVLKFIMSGDSSGHKLTSLESWLSFIIFWIIMCIWMIGALSMILKPYLIYKSCKRVQSKINSNETVCFYQRAPKKEKPNHQSKARLCACIRTKLQSKKESSKHQSEPNNQSGPDNQGKREDGSFGNSYFWKRRGARFLCYIGTIVASLAIVICLYYWPFISASLFGYLRML